MCNVPMSDCPRSSSLAGELPEEILRQIFIMALPDDHLKDDLLIARAQTIALPIHLSHVCRFWRQVALFHRRLWSFISLSFDVQQREKLGRTVEVFDAFLARTRGCPLNFYIRCNLREDGDYSTLNGVEHIIEATLEQQHLWEHVSFHWQDVKLPVGFRCFGDFKIDNAPLLKSLRLNATLLWPTSNDWKLWDPYSATIDISKCPRIKSLTLDGDFALDFGRATNHSLAECTLIPFREPSSGWCARTCMDVLRHAPALQSLTLRNEYHYESLRAFQSDELVHGLRKLSLRHGSSSEAILDGLHLPDLKELYFDDTWGIPTRALRTLQLLQRSRPLLTCLSMHGRSIETNTILDMLRIQPALSELDIQVNPGSANKVLRAFDLKERDGWCAVEDDDSVLCKRLRTIRLRKATNGKKEWRNLSALYPMTETRHRAFHTLNVIRVQNRQMDTDMSCHVRTGYFDLDSLIPSANCISIETVDDAEA